MFARTLATRASRLPQLAATAALCFAIGANTHIDAPAPAQPAAAIIEAAPAAIQSQDIAAALEVLSADDASLYRAIFTAQAKSDWSTADFAIAKVKNRALMGHALADRYMRRPASFKELQGWLALYSDLPEAGDIYSRALVMAGKETRLKPPASAQWTGGEGYDASLGFRLDNGPNAVASPAAQRFDAKLGRALHRGDALKAEVMLEAEQHKRAVPAAERARAQGRIAAGFFVDGQIAHARYLTDVVAADADPLALWTGGLAAWKEKDDAAAARSFGKLAAIASLSPWDRAAAQFWAYRAENRQDHTEAARTWLEAAAKQPHSFYGILAAQLLGRSANWSWQLPTLDAGHIATLTQELPGWRALALLQSGQRDLAETELRYLNPQGKRDLQDAMLALAEAEHMPSLALQLGGMATRANGAPYDAALYPLPPWQPTQGFEVDRALVYALMRHESQFDPLAVSARGACGLMQVMPNTAQMMMRGTFAARECSERLLDPATNMALGQKYVRRLASKPAIGDNLLLLLAAYNGGPNKLPRWLHDNGDRDPLLFLESMPVRQTHDYVEQVLMHYWIYRARLGESEKALTELARGDWPRFTLGGETRSAMDAAAADRTKTIAASASFSH